MKFVKRLISALLIPGACVLLTACQNAPESLTTQSDGLTTKATVNCGEDTPFHTLPSYPECSECDQTDDPAVLRDYIAAQQAWAVDVIGVHTWNSILRDNTAGCLRQLRDNGIIN
ncbi:hypothetical protein HEM31_010935 [Escherichia coli]|nr:hypothetical protein [Escherichia coli]